MTRYRGVYRYRLPAFKYRRTKEFSQRAALYFVFEFLSDNGETYTGRKVRNIVEDLEEAADDARD